MKPAWDIKARYILRDKSFLLKPAEIAFLKIVSTGTALTMPQIILFQDITRRYIDSLISEVYAKIDKIDRFNKLGIEDDKNSGNS